MSHSPHTTDTQLRVIAWDDPVVDTRGFSVSDPYIEMFWLPVLGPTATWLYRRMASGVLGDSAECTVSMSDLARSIGVSYTTGRHNPFTRALDRCIMFGVAQNIAVLPVRTLAVRRALPMLPQRHLARLPHELQIAHSDWMHVPIP